MRVGRKSTLLNIVGGLDVPTSGSVHYEDWDLSAATDSELTDYEAVASRIAEVPGVKAAIPIMPTESTNSAAPFVSAAR